MSTFGSNQWLGASTAPQVPVQVNPFEPLRIYDKPEILVSSALEGELTPSLIRRLFNPNETLSLKERDTIVTRLKERVGGGSVGSVLVDLATNPFVWFMFLTSPIGGTTVGKGASGLFAAAKRYGPFVAQHAPWLQTLGALTPMQVFNNTAITPTLNAVSHGIHTLDTEMAAVVGPSLRKVLTRNNLGSLDLRDLADPREIELAQDINRALFAKLGGMDKKWVEYRWKLKKGKDGTLALKRSKTTHAVKVNGHTLDAFLRRTGTDELVDSYRRALDQRWARMFGNEAEYARTGAMVPDDDKVVRLWRGVRANPVTSGQSGLYKDAGSNIIRRLFGEEVGEALRKGMVTPTRLRGIIRAVVTERPEHYLPRNILMAEFGAAGRNRLAAQRTAARIVSTGAVIPRGLPTVTFDPLEMGAIAEKFGGTAALRREIAEAEKRIAAAGDAGKRINVFAVDGLESLKRYFKSSGESHSLYVQKAEGLGGIQVARRDFNPQAHPHALELVAKSQGRWKARGLWGGESLADVLYEQHSLIVSPHTRRTLTDVVLPRILERPKFHETGAVAAMLAGKQGLAAFLETKAGQALKGVGGWGARLHATMERMANADVSFPRSRTYSAALAKWLYTSHLGLNLNSVVLNLTQPFLLVTSQLGVKATLKGYKEAFGELSGYLGERARQGFRLLTDDEQFEMVGRHFKHANFNGENLIDLAPKDVFDDLDRMAAARLRDFSRLRTDKHKWITDMPLALFQKAEWLNRSVTAHAIEDVWRRSGRPLTAGSADYFRMVEDIRRGVAEFQFGARVMNTPAAFLREGVLNNPLARQFLTFPLRTLTHVVHVGPRMGGRLGLWRAAGFDVFRGLGVSAVIYEAAKGAFGADLSGGLYASAATDLFGGERMLEDGQDWIPLPPVVDIPVDFIRGVAAQDMDLMGRAASRLFPGGVAWRRLLGVTPQLPLPAEIGRLVQGTYADYEAVGADGTVPVYKGDGTLTEYRNAVELLLRGMGADLGRFNTTGEMVGYLVQQRDRIVESRRKALAAYLANDIRAGDAVRSEFAREHGFPLTISREQLQAAIRNRQTPRVERILDRLPGDARPFYQQMVAQTRPEITGLPNAREALVLAETARQRDQLRRFSVQLDPATVTRLRELVAAQEKVEGAGRQFAPFPSFR